MKTLSVVIPCYNEQGTLAKCVARVFEIADTSLAIEVIIIDDCSTDTSLKVANDIADQYKNVQVLAHSKNKGKGAALRTGFKHATGDYVAVQDADLEYDPTDLKKLLLPLMDGRADVVLGSRFLSSGVHRVFYFWHFMGNRFLTFFSNMFTDLNLTDMETCYKVFKREIIQDIELKEDRFGFEPEIVAEIAHRRLKIYEMGISYDGRSYAEGKKIGAKDGFRALYCIVRYNAYRAPVAIQFLIYLLIGGTAAIANLLSFLAFISFGWGISLSVLTSFGIAAIINYLLCIKILFRSQIKWKNYTELFVFFIVAASISLVDLAVTKLSLASGMGLALAKLTGVGAGFIFNFLGRKYIVFPEQPSGSWR